MNLSELILECVDALESPSHDNACRDDHIDKIAEALQSGQLSAEQQAVLGEAAAIFKFHKHCELTDFMSGRARREVQLAERLSDLVPMPSRYVYHGTVQRRLRSIVAEGLVPGKQPVWHGLVDAAHLASAVFFASSWRAALDWAEFTHARTRGPKESLGRTPVVIRIKMGDLDVVPDRLAAKPGSFMVLRGVPAENAEVILGRVQGMPTWQPINDVA